MVKGGWSRKKCRDSLIYVMAILCLKMLKPLGFKVGYEQIYLARGPLMNAVGQLKCVTGLNSVQKSVYFF